MIYNKFAIVAALSLVFATSAYGISESIPAEAETSTTVTGGVTDEENEEEEDENLEYGWSYPGYVVADRLNIREDANEKSRVLFKLNKYSILSVNCSKDGKIYAPDGWAFINYIDYEGGHEGYAASRYLRVFDVNTPPKSFYDHIDRELVAQDGSSLYGMLSIERNGDSLTGTMWVKSSELQESGGSGTVIWVDFKGGFYYGDVPVFEATSPEAEEIYGEFLRKGVAYDSENDIFSFGGELWK